METTELNGMKPSGGIRLEGRHAVVTGGSRGIGAAIAARLAAAGARLTLIGRDTTRIEAAAARLSATPLALDVTSEEQVERAFSNLGPVDILVNSAGAAKSAPFGKTGLALWNDMLSVNLTAVFLCSRAVVAGMRKKNSGRIVNVASMAGLEPYRYVAAYVAAKHGVVGLTRALALELADTGITANAVCPGYTDTDMFRDAVANLSAKTSRPAEEAAATLLRSNRQVRLVSPDEVAGTVLWLCGSDAASVTGESIVLSGGRTG